MFTASAFHLFLLHFLSDGLIPIQIFTWCLTLFPHSHSKKEKIPHQACVTTYAHLAPPTWNSSTSTQKWHKNKQLNLHFLNSFVFLPNGLISHGRLIRMVVFCPLKLVQRWHVLENLNKTAGSDLEEMGRYPGVKLLVIQYKLQQKVILNQTVTTLETLCRRLPRRGEDLKGKHCFLTLFVLLIMCVGFWALFWFLTDHCEELWLCCD